jgi:hypothetical protein
VSHIPLKNLLLAVRSSLESLASSKNVTVSTRFTGTLPKVNGNRPAITRLTKCVLKELILCTPRRRTVELTARSVPRGAGWGRGRWVEVGLNSSNARFEKKQLESVLRCLGPLRLAEAVTDFYRGELHLTLVCRVEQLKGAWFVIRSGTQDVPKFAVVLKATSRLA